MRKQKRHSVTVGLILWAAVFLLPLMTVGQVLVRKEETPPLPPVFSGGEADSARTLRVLEGETVTEMELGTYLACVLRAEMPASFPLEALKAQAVAARTYTLYQLRGGARHETADICTDHTCCQAYKTAEQAWTAWGADAATYEEKIRTAVEETDGEVLVYDGAPILAVFHSSSPGLTRPSGAVWSEDLPYLQAVPSPEEGSEIPNYFSRVEYSAAEVKERFLALWPDMDFSAPKEAWFSDAVRDEALSVVSVTVGGVEIRGAQMRSALGLRSACVTWQVEGEKFIFHVTGYGHGVGMSQYGAAAMAQAGAAYGEILEHYYTGAVVEKM